VFDGSKTRLTGLVASFVVVLVFGTLAGTGRASAREAGARKVSEPVVAARAWALMDLRSGEYLAGDDASEELPIASTTKIMAALVALDGADLDEEVTISQDAAAYATPAYSNVGLLPGDTLSVRELLMGALISSGDDAAYALAEHVGGGGEAGVNAFVARMNERAGALGLEHTHFENPVGFDERGHYSSAQDLAKMAQAAMRNPEFRKMVSTQYATIYTPGREIPLTNTNLLLSTYGPATGIKTGTTPGAGESLVSSAARGVESYVCVILDSKEERFAASVRALRYGLAAYDRTDLVLEGERYATVGVPYRRDENIDLVAKGNVAGLVDAGSDVERDVELAADLPDSAGAGTRLGRVIVKVDGNRVGQTPLVAKKGYRRASLGQRVWYTVGGIFE
jgi:D-alanyl-D-alanine carboxypeptidase (penicillin-binding protein 5/6)